VQLFSLKQAVQVRTNLVLWKRVCRKSEDENGHVRLTWTNDGCDAEPRFSFLNLVGNHTMPIPEEIALQMPKDLRSSVAPMGVAERPTPKGLVKLTVDIPFATHLEATTTKSRWKTSGIHLLPFHVYHRRSYDVLGSDLFKFKYVFPSSPVY
jgi:hypothetical protein